MVVLLAVEVVVFVVVALEVLVLAVVVAAPHQIPPQGLVQSLPGAPVQYASLLSHHGEFIQVEVRHPVPQWQVPRLLWRAVHQVFLTGSQDLQFTSDFEHHET